MVSKTSGGKVIVKISIEKGAGFCFGVSKLIDMAEEILDKGEKLYCLGEIVHNEKEVKRLVDKGMQFITVEDLKELHNTSVMIRAHGEPPSTFEICEKNTISVIDGTCPIVRALQKKIKKAHESSDTDKEQILIYGKNDHPEVIGLKGQTNGKAIVINDPDQLKNTELNAGVSLFSQTTMDSEGFKEIEEALFQKSLEDPKLKVHVNNTICKHISHRQPGITEFARNNDLIIFVAGKNSSNGKILFEICKKENSNCIFISETEEVRKEWLTGYEKIGITGGTSTPDWLLSQTAEKIKKLLS